MKSYDFFFRTNNGFAMHSLSLIRLFIAPTIDVNWKSIENSYQICVKHQNIHHMAICLIGFNIATQLDNSTHNRHRLELTSWLLLVLFLFIYFSFFVGFFFLIRLINTLYTTRSINTQSKERKIVAIDQTTVEHRTTVKHTRAQENHKHRIVTVWSSNEYWTCDMHYSLMRDVEPHTHRTMLVCLPSQSHAQCTPTILQQVNVNYAKADHFCVSWL